MTESEDHQGDEAEGGQTIPSLRDTGEQYDEEQKERKTESPDAGYPAGETEPLGGERPSHEHPEDVGATPSDDPTRQSSGPPDSESGAD